MENKLEKFRFDWFTTGRETQPRTTPLMLMKLYNNLAAKTDKNCNTKMNTRTKPSLSSRWVRLSENLVLLEELESFSSLLFHSLTHEWKLLTNFLAHFLPRTYPPAFFAQPYFDWWEKGAKKIGQQFSLTHEWVKEERRKIFEFY